MPSMTEQLREIMAGVETRAPDLSGVSQDDTEKAVKNLLGEETPQDEENEPKETEEPETQETEEAVEDEEPDAAAGKTESITLKDLAEQLEWRPQDLYKVEIPLADGDKVTIGEYKDLVQESRAIKERQGETDEALSQREAELKTAEARLAEAMDNAAPQELLKAEAQLYALQDEYQRINWGDLETKDPARWAMLKRQFDERFMTAKQNKDMIEQNFNAYRQDIAKQQALRAEQGMKQAVLNLHRLIPEWADESTFARGRENVVEYGVKNGIDENVMRSISDPALVAFMYKKMNADEKFEKAKPVEKAPKVVKAQMQINKKVARKTQQEKTLANAKKSRDTRDKVAAVSELLRGTL